jgi:hypothetical protein
MITDEVEGPTSRKNARNGAQLKVGYGETVIVAGGAPTILPIAAVMVTVPPVVRPGTIKTVPADTVARLVLLEVQVATLVTFWEPLHVAAVAIRLRVGWLLLTVPLVEFNVIAVIHPTVTVTVCVLVIDGFALAVAVTVAVPVLTDVTKPAEEMVATLVGVMVQARARCWPCCHHC